MEILKKSLPLSFAHTEWKSILISKNNVAAMPNQGLAANLEPPEAVGKGLFWYFALKSNPIS